MLSIGAAVYFVSARMTRETEAELQRDLTEAATLVDEQRRTQFDNVARTARLIADLPKFKAGGRHRRPADARADRRRLSAAGRRRPADRDRPARRACWRCAGDRRARVIERRAGPEAGARRHGVAGVLAAPARRPRSRERAGHARPRAPGDARRAQHRLPARRRRAAQFKALTGADIAFAMDGARPRLDARARRRARPWRRCSTSTGVTAHRDRRRGIRRARRSRSAPAAAPTIRRRSSCARAASACARWARSRPRSAGIALGATLLADRRQLRRGAHHHPAARDHHRSHAAGRRHRRPDAQDRHQAPRRLGRRGRAHAGDDLQHADRLDRALPARGRRSASGCRRSAGCRR